MTTSQSGKGYLVEDLYLTVDEFEFATSAKQFIGVVPVT